MTTAPSDTNIRDNDSDDDMTWPGEPVRKTPDAPRRIVVWRHGRTIWNAEQRFQGQTDIALDETGIAQAKRAGAMLASLRPQAIVASDLMRARDTAAYLAELVGLDVILDPGLRETYAGAWEGMTRPQIEAQFAADYARWPSDPSLRPGGDGETRVEVAERAEAAILRALEKVDAGGTLVVATHGGSARAAIGRLLGLPPEHWGILGVLTNTSWSVLVEAGGPLGPPWRLQEYNAGTLPEPALADDR